MIQFGESEEEYYEMIAGVRMSEVKERRKHAIMRVSPRIHDRLVWLSEPTETIPYRSQLVLLRKSRLHYGVEIPKQEIVYRFGYVYLKSTEFLHKAKVYSSRFVLSILWFILLRMFKRL